MALIRTWRLGMGGQGRWLAGMLLACMVPAWAGDLVVGRDATWTRSVSNRGPGPAHGGGSPRAPLIFWMTYHGSEATLRYLAEKGALPIRHRWSVVVGGEVELETPDDNFIERLSVPLEVGSGRKGIITRLAGQLAAKDSFTWRTWSRKQSVSSGVWRVEVLYDDETPVVCEANGKLKPCVFRIKIR